MDDDNGDGDGDDDEDCDDDDDDDDTDAGADAIFTADILMMMMNDDIKNGRKELLPEDQQGVRNLA